MPEDRLRQLALAEQASLWNDLSRSLNMALNGCWSMGASSVMWRIIRNAKVVGFVDAGKIQIPLLSSGIYQEVLHILGVEAKIDFDLNEYKDHFHINPLWATETINRIRQAKQVGDFDVDEEDYK